MVEVIWADPALSDLEAIAEYIALDKPEAASNLVRRIFSRVEMLSKHPQAGPALPELRPSSRYRRLVEPLCRIIYRHDQENGKLYILGVMRGEKLFQRRLLERRDKRSMGG